MQFFIALLPALMIAGLLTVAYRAATAPVEKTDTSGLVEAGGAIALNQARSAAWIHSDVGSLPVG